jgi:hypothetical protein
MQFLDDAWFEAASTAIASIDTTGTELIIQQHVTGSRARDYFLHVTGGTVRLLPGLHPSPSVTFKQAIETATAVRRGEINVLTAVQQGLIDVAGDVQALISNRAVLARIDNALSQLPS